MSLISNPKVEAFYFTELPRILFWIGLVVVVFNIGLFLINWSFGGVPRIELLLPGQSGLVSGMVAFLLSISIRSNGLFTLILSLSGPLLVIFFYQSLKNGIVGITPSLPLEMGALAFGALKLFGCVFFVALTYKYHRESKFPN